VSTDEAEAISDASEVAGAGASDVVSDIAEKEEG
jgi:hypothetical protein